MKPKSPLFPYRFRQVTYRDGTGAVRWHTQVDKITNIGVVLKPFASDQCVLIPWANVIEFTYHESDEAMRQAVAGQTGPNPPPGTIPMPRS